MSNKDAFCLLSNTSFRSRSRRDLWKGVEARLDSNHCITTFMWSTHGYDGYEPLLVAEGVWGLWGG
jgi:hypothetical protein